MGNVGYHAAKYFHEAGAVIVGLIEWDGALYSDKGMDPDAVLKHRNETGSIVNFPGATTLKNNAEGLEMDCDILIPAALENVIHKENAPRIKAKIIGEAANGPITPEADEILNQKGVIVVPDMFLNAGGVTVSYFEWLKNLSHVRYGRLGKRFDENMNIHILSVIEDLTGKSVSDRERKFIAHGADEVDLVYSGLEETMHAALHEVRTIMMNHKDIHDMRTAAYVCAIDKVGAAYDQLGIFP